MMYKQIISGEPKCPECGSDVVDWDGELEQEGASAWEHFTCGECGCEGNAVFAFSHYEWETDEDVDKTEYQPL